MTSEVAFLKAGRSADALKAEKPGPVKLKDLVGAGLKLVPVHSEEVGSSVDEFLLSFVIKPGNLNLAIRNPHY